jgi:hypothetical protein
LVGDVSYNKADIVSRSSKQERPNSYRTPNSNELTHESRLCHAMQYKSTKSTCHYASLCSTLFPTVYMYKHFPQD